MHTAAFLFFFFGCGRSSTDWWHVSDIDGVPLGECEECDDEVDSGRIDEENPIPGPDAPPAAHGLRHPAGLRPYAPVRSRRLLVAFRVEKHEGVMVFELLRVGPQTERQSGADDRGSSSLLG